MEFSFEISQLPWESLVTDLQMSHCLHTMVPDRGPRQSKGRGYRFIPLLLRFQMHWELVWGLQTGKKCVHTLSIY